VQEARRCSLALRMHRLRSPQGWVGCPGCSSRRPRAPRLRRRLLGHLLHPCTRVFQRCLDQIGLQGIDAAEQLTPLRRPEHSAATKFC